MSLSIKNIPSDWEFVKLSELTSVITKGTTPTTNGFSYLKNGVNFVKVESIHSNGTFIPSKFAYVGNDCHNSFKRSQLYKDDILFTIAGALGRSAIVEKNILPANTNQAVAIIRLKNLDNKDYIFHYLRGNSIKKLIERINVSTAQANLSLGQINNFKIPFPPLQEQQKIAEILSTVDAKISIIDAQISETQNLKKGLMQSLLSKGIGHTEFKKSALGEIPKSWEVVEIGEIISELLAGVSVNSEDRESQIGEIGILKTSALFSGKFSPKKHKTVIKKDIHRVKLNPLKNTILISRMNTPLLVGECGFVDVDYPTLFIPDRIWMIKFSDDFNVSAKWLSYVLSSYTLRNQIKLIATGTSNSMKNISKPSLLGIKIIFPPLQEQEKIASILSSVDEKLDVLSEKKSDYQNLKKGLMQQLLTGLVRVSV
ncbi:restriction endonuclease subunit S [Tenacibaculum finnmarkense genomovar ulcerans]|uniref:restriction endonuclease subunit S n=1 Tax=Tenacibaculum finnmarkense TaxID=2781243 RepID=UPI00187BBABB|nr:restriction endonuclease subunit S [Tenacibaculum finnmarkense]MBE7632983.1 restriction endonuclease subunit S [Tenacibaculum finnmarkense genomovar ulcerans]MCD8428901.1 restriction endonuclease subunit S [Tenacibaculum finnmarkense genomovar ulcerans]